MKLIERVRLELREGTSDKVYEVDLCEVAAGSFVVNFRFGRRGRALREGTKTDQPVDMAKARKVFDSLVADKRRGGYRQATDPSAPAPAVESPASPAGHERSTDALADRLLARLAQGDRGTDSLVRTIWKVGVARLTRAESLLLELVSVSLRRADPLRTYSIVWALARSGSPRSIPVLESVRDAADAPRWLRDLAVEAIRLVSDPPARGRLGAAELAAMPEPLRRAHGAGDAAEFQRAMVALLDSDAAAGCAAVARAYRIDDDITRPAVVAFARAAATSGLAFERLRALYKLAELRSDGELFGLIGYRFETAPARPTDWRAGKQAFSQQTRRYLRRRTARALRRLGQIDSPELVPMAVGALLPFTDADGGQVIRGVRVWDRFAGYWAFNMLLHQHSPRYEPGPNGRAWRMRRGANPGDPPPSVREEAFPTLWDARPDALFDLLRRSRCEPVHQMAARALEANAAFLAGLGDSDIALLLRAPYLVTQRLGLAQARQRPLGRELLHALIDSELAEARALAHRWVDEHRTQLYRDTELIARLVVGRFADTRAFALDYLRTITVDADTARVIIGRVVAELVALGEAPADDERAAGAAAILLRVFARPLAEIGADVIRRLLAHPLRAVQELAAEILLAHDTLARAPADGLIDALLDSAHPSVRAMGARLFSQLPEDALAEHPALLVYFATAAQADLRSGTRELIGRLAASHPAFAIALATELTRALLRRLPEGAPAHIVSLLRHELAATRPLLGKDEVLRLIHALSPHAQEAGGLLLAGIEADELELAEIVRLADHDMLSVRESAWALARAAADRFRVAMPALARLVDVDWEDSRRFGLELLAEIGGDHITPDVLIAICDSVRPEVQRHGRELIARHFEAEHGVEYLMRLAEHPSPGLQMFVSSYLEAYAAGQPERLRRLVPYFTTVLSQVNRGGVAKRRALAFLRQEAEQAAESAAVIGPILDRQSATISVRDKAKLIAAMTELALRHPELPLPLQVREVPRR